MTPAPPSEAQSSRDLRLRLSAQENGEIGSLHDEARHLGRLERREAKLLGWLES